VLAHSYRDGERISQVGWHSADLGAIENGRLVVKGRVDDQIKVSGNLVNLQTLAELTRTCHGVIEAATAGREDAEYGFIPIIAYQGDVDTPEVESFVRSQLSVQRIPLIVTKVAEIPLLANGKPDRQSIAAL
jgi:O-succinylbenzoic acid--CoA ligase